MKNQCGRVWQKEGTSFSFHLFRHENKSRTHEHEHGKSAFCIGLEGALKIVSNKVQLTVSPRTFIFLPYDLKHSESGIIEGLCLLAFTKEDFSSSNNSPEISNRAIGRITNELQHDDDLTPLVLDSILYELTQRSIQNARYGKDYVTSIAERLKEDFLNPPTVTSLAREYGFSRQHVARIFSSQYGCSIGEYVRQVRVKRAARLLQNCSDSLSVIALRTGFADQSHLTRSFKRETGWTPAAYRESRKNN